MPDYGEKKNDDLREKYDVDKDKFPVYKMFKAGGGKPVSFKGEVTADALTRFLVDEADVSLTLPGTLKKFDEIVKRFLAAEGKSDADIAAAEAEMGHLKVEADKVGRARGAAVTLGALTHCFPPGRMVVVGVCAPAAGRSRARRMCK